MRERLLVLRDRAAVLRGFFAVLARVPVDLLAPEARLAPAPADFARVELALRVPAGFARALLLRVVPEVLAERALLFRAVPDVLAERALLFLPVPDLLAERELLDFARVDLLRPLLAPDEPEPPELSSAVHLPDMTRCAASATASAMIEPSLVALDITLVAAAEALSAASRPASRILRRAAGLALIAAAAAARPAASISLLIAAFASLSVKSLLVEVREDLEEDPEELLREDFAIAFLPALARKTLYCRNSSLT